MMTGATGGRGGGALGNHLAATADMGAGATPGISRGLVSDTTQGRIAELTKIASRARTAKPLYHVFARPPEGSAWTKQAFARFWEGFEREFKLEKQPFAEAIHDNGGHEHRVYSLVRRDGTTTRMGNDYARREKLERVAEFDRGEAFIKGAHNKAVIQALEKERPEVAAAMLAAGLHEGPRPVAPLTPTERAQQERTATRKVDVAQAVAIAWAASDSGQAFAAALAEHGLVLARGDRRGGVPVIVDSTGNTHAVTRMLNMAAKADGAPATPGADIAARLDGMALPSVAGARQAVAMRAPASPPDDGPPSPDVTTSPSSGQAAPVSTGAAHVPAPASHGHGASPPAASQAAPGAALDDAGPGPGEPPGPNAHPDEIARYRASVAVHEDRKAAAWARWIAQQRQQGGSAAASAQSAGGQDHGFVQHQTATHTHAGRAAAAVDGGDARPASPEPPFDAGASGDDRAGSGDGPAAWPDHRGHAQADGPGGEPARGSPAAGRRGEHGADGRRDAAGGHRLAAGEHGQQALQHRVQAARAARALAGLNTEALLDRVLPERAAMRLVEAAQARLDARRARAPHPNPATRDPDAEERRVRRDAYAPVHPAQEALRAALDRQWQAPPVPGGHRWLPWTTAQEAEHQALAHAVVTAHAAVAAARPNPGEVAGAVRLARMHAENRTDEHQAWLRMEGQQIDREQRLLDGVWTAVHRRDPAALHAFAGGGLGAAMRLQAGHEAAMDGYGSSTGVTANVRTFHHPGGR